MSITLLRIKNFKGLEDAEIELGDSVVFVGPNNSGKTTALQALTLWSHGLAVWLSRRRGGKAKEKAGVTLNRRDLTHIPVRDSRELWRNLSVSRMLDGKQQNVNIEIEVQGIDTSTDTTWTQSLLFYRANSESIYCKPRDLDKEIPDGAEALRIALMPPMSGLAPEEPELTRGRIDVLVGRGQTAEVLRNICLQVHSEHPDSWNVIASKIDEMFGVKLGVPARDTARGEVLLNYVDRNGVELDLVAAGRGQQQVLLLLAHLYLNRRTTLLLDEPDAHLEILRQRQIYSVVTETAKELSSQVIVASHSEIVLNEAAERDIVVGFVGSSPHRIDDKGSQLRKSLTEIGFEDYYLAETTRFVLYLEGSTDLAILRAWAQVLEHEAVEVLARPFVKYVANQPNDASKHFYGIREGVQDLSGFALFDRLDKSMPEGFSIPHHCWRKCEIENYLLNRDLWFRYVSVGDVEDLVDRALIEERREALSRSIDELAGALETLGRPGIYSDEIKASTDVLEPLFRRYARIRGIPETLSKSDFYLLAAMMKPDEVGPEVREVLDKIVRAAKST